MLPSYIEQRALERSTTEAKQVVLAQYARHLQKMSAVFRTLEWKDFAPTLKDRVDSLTKVMVGSAVSSDDMHRLSGMISELLRMLQGPEIVDRQLVETEQEMARLK